MIIEKLENKCIRKNVEYGAYDYNSYTLEGLLVQFFKKINELVDDVNAVNLLVGELKDYIVNEGLSTEVNKAIEKLIDDGTLSNLINQTLFSSLLEKIGTNQQDILTLNNKFEVQSKIYNDNFNKLSSEYKRPINCKYPTLSTTLFPHYSPADDTDIIKVYKRQGLECSLCVMIGISSLTDNIVTIDSLERIKNCVSKLKEEGVNVTMIKPHLGVNYRDDTYRGNINPTDKDIFFDSLNTVLCQISDICAEFEIPNYCISTEFDKLTINEYSNKWGTIIENINNRNKGLNIVISLSTIEWNSLNDRLITLSKFDIIGLNIYLSFTNKSVTDPTVTSETIANGFEYNQWGSNVISAINLIELELAKQIYITEVGVTSTMYGLTKIEIKDETVREGQQKFYRAFLETIPQIKSVIGFNIWDTNTPWAYFNKGYVNNVEQMFIDFMEV